MRSVPGAIATGSTPPRYNKPDAIEYVRIRNDQLRAKDGRYDLRVTNELEEAMFVDRLQLFVVTHPIGTEVVSQRRHERSLQALSNCSPHATRGRL